MSSRRPKIEMIQRRKEVARLYLAGYTQLKIAEILGISRITVNRDVQAILAQWQEETNHDVGKLVAKQSMHIEDIRLRAWSAYQKAVGEGKDGELGEKRVRGEKELNALALLLRVLEREAKLYGLDAPTRTEVTNTEPIEVIWRMVDEADNSDT